MTGERPDDFTVLAEYRVLERIGGGEGGSSTLYRVENLLLGRTCVAKLLNLSFLAAEGTDILHEARALQECSHPSICQIYGAGYLRAPGLHAEEARQRADLQAHPLVAQAAAQPGAATHLAIFMPEYSGGSLAGRLKSGPLSPAEAVEVLRFTLGALSAAHLRGILHLDLKPSNVLFGADGRPVLADFGQSARLNSLGIATGPRYAYRMCMPPEYYTGEAVPHLTVPSEIYVAGAFAYRLLNGEFAWEAAVNRAVILRGLFASICEGTFPDRELYLPHVPPPLRRAVNRALNLKEAKRFQSASDLSEALRRARGDRTWSGAQTGPDSYRVWKGESSVEIYQESKSWHLGCSGVLPGAPGPFLTRKEAFDAVTRAIHKTL